MLACLSGSKYASSRFGAKDEVRKARVVECEFVRNTCVARMDAGGRTDDPLAGERRHG
jgi:hypothetical protein